MGGLWVLFVLIALSALPVAGVFIWFRVSGYPLSLRWFAGFLGCGAAALLPAALLQSLFPPAADVSFPSLLFKTFIQIALTEEGGRLIALSVLVRLARPWEKMPGPARPSYAAAAGLLTGLGFALAETAFYGVMDLGLTLLRAITAAPLHGACGARVGLALFSMKEGPGALRGALRFCTAAAIHGMYNLMIVSPGVLPFLAVLIAFSALGSALITIRSGSE